LKEEKYKAAISGFFDRSEIRYIRVLATGAEALGIYRAFHRHVLHY